MKGGKKGRGSVDVGEGPQSLRGRWQRGVKEGHSRGHARLVDG